MKKSYAQKEFGHTASNPDVDYLTVLRPLQTIRYAIDDRKTAPLGRIVGQNRKRKAALGIMSQRPDMSTVIVLRVLHDHIVEKYGINFKVATRFKNSNLDMHDPKMSACLGALETAYEIFYQRKMELEFVLSDLPTKMKKCAHGIRDIGTFSPDAYEQGRREAYNTVILAMPRSREFQLLEEAPVAENIAVG